MSPVTAEQSVDCNLPNETGHWSLSIYSTLEVTGNNGTVYVARNRDSGNIYSRRALNSKFWPWVKHATATPPQEYNLPLADGVSTLYGCTYRKDQFGNIVVRMAAKMATGSAGIVTIATLPEGYVPAQSTEIPITLVSAGNTYSASSAKIEGGAIRAFFPSAATYSIYINCIL